MRAKFVLGRGVAGAMGGLLLLPALAQAVAFDSDPTISSADPPREGQVVQLTANGNPHADLPLEDDPTTTTEWLRCDGAGGGCVLTGATGSTYSLAAGDVGGTIRVRVTAESNLETEFRDSSPTGQVRTDPSNDVPPIIAGIPRDGETLTITSNVWSGTGAITFAWQWFRCTATFTTCGPIPGATAPTYVLTPDDIGSRVLVQVTADSEGGPSRPSVLSPLTEVIEAAPPLNTARPDITGALRQGRLLTLSQGAWTGTPPLTFSYRWQRCTGQTVASCENIPGTTELDYRLTANDVANRVRVVVTANNPAPGDVDATSPLTEEIAAPDSAAPAPRLMSPFPRVAISGVARRRGSAVTLLSVRGPSDALVTVFCSGRSCPFARARRRIGRRRVIRIAPLERTLRPGTEIELLVTRPGAIGKYTRFLIRRGKRPKRRDACVRPGATGPSPCP